MKGKLKKQVTGIVVCTVLLAAMTACGNNSTSPEQPQTTEQVTTQSTTPPTIDPTGVQLKTVTVSDIRGNQVTFAQPPERVAVISSPLVSVLDVMGVKIVAANTLKDSV